MPDTTSVCTTPRSAPKRSERGLGPRNPWGEVRKGGEAPLRGRGEIDPFIEAYLFSKAK